MNDKIWFKRNKVNRMPYVIDLAKTTILNDYEEPIEDEKKFMFEHNGNHREEELQSINDVSLEYKPYSIDETVPEEEIEWMQTQLQGNFVIPYRLKWMPETKLDLKHIKITNFKLVKCYSQLSHRDDAEESFRSNVSKCCPIIINDKKFTLEEIKQNNESVEIMKQRIKKILVNYKNRLRTVLDDNAKQAFLKEIMYQRVVFSQPVGPTLAARVLQETISTRHGSSFLRWMIVSGNELRLCRLQAPDGHNWKKEIDREMSRISKEGTILYDLQNELFQVSVPQHSFSILIGAGGRCEFLRSNEIGCSLIFAWANYTTEQMQLLWSMKPTIIEKIHVLEDGKIPRRLCVLTFSTPYQARALLEQEALRAFDLHQCPRNLCLGSYSQSSNESEIVSLNLRWQKAPPKNYLYLTIEDSSFARFAIEVFAWHNVTAQLLHRRPGGKTFKIGNQPSRITNTVEAKEWACSILGPVKIIVNSVKMCYHPPQLLDDISKSEVCLGLSGQFVRCAREKGLWLSGNENNPIDSLSLRQYVADYTRFPWTFKFDSGDPIFHQVTATFKKRDQGIAIVSHMLSLAEKRQLVLNRNERRQADHLGQYSRKIEVASELRLACQKAFEDFNYMPFGKPMQKISLLKWIKIGDVRSESQKTSTISICGWPKSYVDEGFDYISELIAPSVLVATTSDEQWLFYGIGATWLQNMLKKEQETSYFLYDFDATRRTLSFWGLEERKKEVIGLIQFVIKNRLFMEISTSINVAPPRFPQSLISIINDLAKCYEIPEYGNGLSCLLKEKNFPAVNLDRLKSSINVQGSLAQYEVLLQLLEHLDQLMYSHISTIKGDDLSLSPPISSRPNCGICLTPVHDDYYCLELCGHIFCRRCINKQVLLVQHNQVEEPFRCANENCDRPFASSDIKRLLLGATGTFTLADRLWWLDAQKLEPFVNASLTRLLSRPGSIFFNCLTPDCQGIFEKQLPSKSRGSSLVVTCDSCQRDHCTYCASEAHSLVPCEIYQELRKDANASLKNYMEVLGSNKITVCPRDGCPAVIEKIAGCNHMRCVKCNTHFCWICKFIADSETLVYRHLTEKHGRISDNPWRFDEAGNLIGIPDGEEDAFLQNLIRLQIFGAQ